MKRVFNRPFPPLAEKSQRLKSAFFIAFFVFLFLFIFRPFGLSQIENGLPGITALYGLITLLFLLLTLFVFPEVFPNFYLEQKWTVGKEIATSMGNVLLIAIGNFLLSCFLGFFPWSLSTLLLFIGFTLAIGIIPVTVQALIRQNYYHRRNTKAVLVDNWMIAKRIDKTDEESMVRISPDEGKEDFTSSVGEILAIESSGNYIEVHRISKKPVLLRKSLNATEDELPDQFLRVHRSWIVHLNSIDHISGNARGYTLSFENSAIQVPVSRGKLKDFDDALRRFSRK